jgi:hypothetical protein
MAEQADLHSRKLPPTAFLSFSHASQVYFSRRHGLLSAVLHFSVKEKRE